MTTNINNSNNNNNNNNNYNNTTIPITIIQRLTIMLPIMNDNKKQ